MNRIIAALAVIIAALTAAPAHAAAGYSPSMWAPAEQQTSGQLTIQLNAPPQSWQIRQAARRMVAQLPGVTLRTSGDCSTVDLCVNVIRYAPTEEEQLQLGGMLWSGLVTLDGPRLRTVRLNTVIELPRTAQIRRHVAAHEFGHALGLEHHSSVGVMSDRYLRQLDVLSPQEVALLTQTYGLG